MWAVKMIYENLLQKILTDGEHIKRKLPLISLYNYNLNLSNDNINELLNDITEQRKKKFRVEFDLFLEGNDSIAVYNYFNISYWNYIGDNFINSYPQYYPKFNKIKNNIKEDSKNFVLYLGNGEKSNQQPCISCIQFQLHNDKLYLSVLQRSCDANLGLLADIYHLTLFANKINKPIENLNILYGNLHIYENNISETNRYIRENGQDKPYKFIQNNLVR
jgi:thymidylate synthase